MTPPTSISTTSDETKRTLPVRPIVASTASSPQQIGQPFPPPSLNKDFSAIPARSRATKESPATAPRSPAAPPAVKNSVDTVSAASAPQPPPIQFPGISTPLEPNLRAQRNGSVATAIGGLHVTVLPDARSRDPKMRNRAETKFAFGRSAPISYKFNSQGLVTSFEPPAVPSVTIKTTYGPGASAADTSGYGRGTTAEDQAAGTTSLGFHEGRHGRDYLEFLRDNPYPVFRGSTQMTEADFKQAIANYQAETAAYSQRMTAFSTQQTDNVGTPGP